MIFRSKIPYFFKKYKTPLSPKKVDGSLAVSLERKYVFSRVAKAGNSTMVATLYFQETGNILTDSAELQYVKDNYFSKPSELRSREVRSLENFYKFIMVRNPYDRFLSGYLDKVSTPLSPKYQKVRKVLNIKDGDHVSIDQFMWYLENGGLYTDRHWLPQNMFLIFPKEEYDLIGKLENIKPFIDVVTDTLYPTSRSEIVKYDAHKTKRAQEGINLAGNMKKRISSLFKDDFEVFEYSK